jgi:hypothetical protein
MLGSFHEKCHPFLSCNQSIIFLILSPRSFFQEGDNFEHQSRVLRNRCKKFVNSHEFAKVGSMLRSLKEKALNYYEKNETRVDIGFFLAGVIFDIFTLSDIDDPLSIAQQVVYLV